MSLLQTAHPRRRDFLLSGLAPALVPFLVRAAQAAPAMKVTRIDTTYWKDRDDAPWWPHWIWVRVRTDSGHEGIGETYPRGEAEASLIHTAVARMLLGRDPRDIERIWSDFYQTFDYQITGGTEMRALRDRSRITIHC